MHNTDNTEQTPLVTCAPVGSVHTDKMLLQHTANAQDHILPNLQHLTMLSQVSEAG